MSSLCIVCCGKKDIQDCILFLQKELKTFIKQKNARFYNTKTLYKAEAHPEMLKNNARLILPANADTSCIYSGFLENDLEILYSKLFSTLETDEASCCQHIDYTFSNLRLLLKEFKRRPLENDLKKSFYDFSINYHTKRIKNSDRLCILNIEFVSVDTSEFFGRIVSNLDTMFPDVFLSAYIDDSYRLNFALQFDFEMLTKRIINTGKAFYISDNLTFTENVEDVAIVQQYNVTRMKNGTWFTVGDECRQTKCDKSLQNNLLLPHYLVVNWSNLSVQNYFPIDYFDTISIYYDGYSHFDPVLFLSRGYTPKQIYILSKEYGELFFHGQYVISDLLANS